MKRRRALYLETGMQPNGGTPIGEAIITGKCELDTTGSTAGISSWSPTVRTVDSVVSRLRRKIERDPQDPELILTEWGVGYKFVDVD